jgi:hypothetical protein
LRKSCGRPGKPQQNEREQKQLAPHAGRLSTRKGERGPRSSGGARAISEL